MNPKPSPLNPPSFSWKWFSHLSLRHKTLLIGATRLVALMLLLGLGIHTLIQNGFNRVEEQYLRDHVTRVQQAFLQSASAMERNVHDYAVWDDSYAFIKHPNQKYMNDNFNQDVLANLRITQALIFGRDLRLVVGRSLEPGAQETGNVAPEIVTRAAPLARELSRSGKLSSSGLLRIGNDLFLAAACQILPTHPGPLALGTFIHMKRVDQTLLQEFSTLLRINLAFSARPDKLEPVPSRGEPGYTILSKTPDLLRVSIPIQDGARQTVGVLETSLPRDIQQQARHFLALFWAALFLVLVTSSLLWPLTLRWLVLGRLERIHQFVASLGREGTLANRLPTREGDELDALALGINQMLDTLEATRHQQRQSEQGTQRLQEQLIQVQKLETIATMAGGIAHDFNNSLGAIMGSLELVREEIPPEHPVHRHLDRMQKAGSGACALAKQMLNLSRTGPVQMAPIHFGDTVSEALRYIRAGLPKTIEITFQDATLDNLVLADATQLQQVIMNLATNASHAMANQPAGCIEVTLREVLLSTPENHPETVTLPPGEYLRLAFSDNGHGIPRELLSKVFNPFFTTKPVGSGTGLGLAVAQGFVARHGGSIGIQSEVGQGTTFILHLPKYHAPAEPSPLASFNHLEILLVDDDTHGRETIAAGLRKASHIVTEASNGAHALQLVEVNPRAFDAVVTDQIMPGMTGMELCESLGRCAPNLPVFLISGYTGPLDPATLQEKGIVQLFMKPIAIHELDQAIREAKRRSATS